MSKCSLFRLAVLGLPMLLSWACTDASNGDDAAPESPTPGSVSGGSSSGTIPGADGVGPGTSDAQTTASAGIGTTGATPGDAMNGGSPTSSGTPAASGANGDATDDAQTADDDAQGASGSGGPADDSADDSTGEGNTTDPTTDGAAMDDDQIQSPRSKVSLNDGWRFNLGEPAATSGLSHAEVRAWVLPTGNAFLNDPASRSERPEGNLGDGHPFLASGFDDSTWESVALPHDYAIAGPYTDSISSSMGRLPSRGVAWYRKTLAIAEQHAGKSFFLDLDGAMSYSMVWVNGQFAGGWPYGYSSYRLDITAHMVPGEDNVIAVRVDNPVPNDAQWDSGSSRWYPGAGLYRNVWLTATAPVHVAQWGTTLTTPTVTESAAAVQLSVRVDNDSDDDVSVEISSELFELDGSGARVGSAVSNLEDVTLEVPAGESAEAVSSGQIANPKRWGTPPTQQPNLYQAVTTLRQAGEVLDGYTTVFGVRTLEFDGDGFRLNGEHIKINGVCLHHDLGPLGAAANKRARERQLQIMAEMGSNAIRTAHNPFEPELLELADRMGLLVLNEAFDVWVEGKTALDHHVFFEDWYEQDLRALIRRDRNHPSVFMWSIGNEVVEQHDMSAGPQWAERLTRIAHEEDPTRPTTAGMNAAQSDDAFSVPIDTVGLNYQGTGVRELPPQYPAYHEAFPDKFVFGTETVSTFSSRGVYVFPVTAGRGETAIGTTGVSANQISSYDLYHADWSNSPDEEFESQDKWPFVGGEFVWTGFDYLGEPTPLDAAASSSYFGIVDIAGLKKDRFFLYQATWRPEHPMAHILPHWTWPSRVGQVTPVHVYTSGDSAELFLNGESLGRKMKAQYEYRLRWDDVVYEPGELAVVAYKNDEQWATASVETVGDAAKLRLTPDRTSIDGDGDDLSFVTVRVLDADDRLVPHASNTITFSVSGPGELVATANGDPTNGVVFPSTERVAFSGMAIAIVRSLPGQSGEILLTASGPGIAEATTTIIAN